jgi:hypothetical protein
MLINDERARLQGLLARFDLMPYEEMILAQGAPCIAMNLVDPPKERPEVWPLAPLGASKIGGFPDLPSGIAWPIRNGFRAGFFMQIALGELPRETWNPWPDRGMVYVFCHDEEGNLRDAPGWELLYFDGPLQALQRSVSPREPLNAESFFFESSDPRQVTFAAGTDFPPGSQGDWRTFVHPLEEAGTARSDPDVLERFFTFRSLSADRDAEINRAKGHGPYFFPVGCLFGHTDRTLAKTKDADWRQIMRLESNPVTEFSGPYDAAPVYVMARDPGKRPWLPQGLVHGICAK